MKFQGWEILEPHLISTPKDITDGVLVDIHSMYLPTAGAIEILWFQLQYLTEVLEWLWSYLFNNFSIAWVISAPSSPISLGIKKSPEFLHEVLSITTSSKAWR